MHPRISILFGLLTMCALAAGQASAQFAGPTLNYVRLYEDAEGISHFETVKAQFEMREYAPPSGPLGVGSLFNATSAVFLSIPSDWNGGLHPAPARQFGVMISGVSEITAGDGEVRRFSPGEVVLLEDISGTGHISKSVTPEGAVIMIVTVPAN